MNYTECEVICELTRKDTPLVSTVPTDEFTKMVSDCFDYDFNGESSFFPFEFPKELLDLPFDIMVITGGVWQGKESFTRRTFTYGIPLCKQAVR